MTERRKAPAHLRLGNKAKVTRVSDEQGRTTGYQIETRDGRQAAVVRPDTVRYRVSVSGKDTE